MYDMTERNELSRRRSALVLAVSLHLGLAALLYLAASDKPGQNAPTSTPVQLEKYQRSAQPKAVKLP